MRSRSLLRVVVCFTVLAVMASSLGMAQTRRHDLSLSYGWGTVDQIADVLEDLVLIVISLGTFYKDDMTFGGAPFLTYHYSRNSKFGFGLAVGGYRSKGTLTSNITDEPVGPFKETNTVLAAEIDLHWILKKGFQLYSGAGFGARFRKGTYTSLSETETYSKVLPTFHLNALGFRFGGKVGFFAELGVGYKGMVNVGLNAQF